jgi:hypothetical protein
MKRKYFSLLIVNETLNNHSNKLYDFKPIFYPMGHALHWWGVEIRYKKWQSCVKVSLLYSHAEIRVFPTASANTTAAAAITIITTAVIAAVTTNITQLFSVDQENFIMASQKTLVH